MEFKRNQAKQKLDTVLEDSLEDFSGNDDNSDQINLTDENEDSQEENPEVQLIPLADEAIYENTTSTAIL